MYNIKYLLFMVYTLLIYPNGGSRLYDNDLKAVQNKRPKDAAIWQDKYYSLVKTAPSIEVTPIFLSNQLTKSKLFNK